MLEDLAIRYVNYSEDGLRALGLFILITGGLLAGATYKSRLELQRGPYFACVAFLTFFRAAQALVYVSLGAPDSFNGGLLWIFVLVDIVATLAFGYGLAVISMARSRDAYGGPGKAFLAFVPIAILWLLFTPSKNKNSPNRMPVPEILSGRYGIVAGACTLYTALMLQIDAEKSPKWDEARIETVLRSEGLEGVLRQMAAEVQTQRIDDVTTLLRVESDGRAMISIYEVSSGLESISDSVRSRVVKNSCDYEPFRPILEAGAIFKHIYQREDGSEIGTITVTSYWCDY